MSLVKGNLRGYDVRNYYFFQGCQNVYQNVI